MASISAAQSAVPQTKNSPKPPFTIDVTVDRVLVPVVVRDKQGDIVSDLKKDDFQVFDDGKPAAVSLFIVEKWAAAGSHSEHNSDVAVLSHAVPIAAPPPASRHRFIVLLMDDMHLEFGDLVHAQKAAVKALDEVLAESDDAVVISLSGKTNSGLTHDRAALRNAIMSVKAQSILRPGNSDCPKLDYYQADLIENKHNPAALQDAEQQVASCNPRMPQAMLENAAETAARSALASGEQDVRVSFASIGASFTCNGYFTRAKHVDPGLAGVSDNYARIAERGVTHYRPGSRGQYHRERPRCTGGIRHGIERK